MTSSSRVSRYEHILDDETATPVDGWVGLDLSERLPDGEGYAYGQFAGRFSEDLYIPETDWQGIIEEREQKQGQLSDLIRHKQLAPLNQGNTNYCWANAPVHCLELVRMKQNQPLVRLSPASVAAPIKRFANRGGWGRDAIRWLADRGAVPVGSWPANSRDQKYYNDSNRELAKNYMVREWVECQPRNLSQMVSLLLRGIPLAAGYNWWGHEVTLCEAIWLDGEVAIRFRNSWGNWGDYGFGIVRGSKMLADDLVGPYSGSMT